MKKTYSFYITIFITVLSLPVFLYYYFSPVFAYAAGTAAKREEIKVLKNQIKAEVKKLKEIESKIHHIKAAQKAKITNLVSVYSSMSPRKAAAIIPAINKRVAVYILSHMTSRTASAIISRMPVKSAVFFTDAIAGK